MSESGDGDSRKIWEKLVLNTDRNVEEVMEFYVEWAKTVRNIGTTTMDFVAAACQLGNTSSRTITEVKQS